MSKIKHYIAHALTLPPHILIQKAATNAKIYITKQYQRQHDKYHSTYSETLIDGALHHYFSKADVEQLASMSEMFSGITAFYLQHRFDLLGSGWVQVKQGLHCQGLEGYHYEMGSQVTADREGKWLEGRINAANLSESKMIWSLILKDYMPIDWHLDFKSGYRWSESTWFQKIKFGHKPGVDIKVPWELARMQHLSQLALAYALTPDTIYVNEFRHQILDFLATNPPRFGVNWRCTMDVGIRIANWLVAYDLFMAYGAEFDTAFMMVFKRSIYEHGHHIINHLEGSPQLRSNHYLADIVGLLYAAAYLPSSKEIDAWLAFAVDEVIKEVKTQFHPDGSNFEASTSYHRLSGELVIYATLLILSLDKHKQKIPYWYIERLQKIAEFTIDMTRPDGLIPQIGDNDNGRFLKLFPVYKKVGEYWREEILDHHHLVATINTLFEHQAFTQFAGIASIESNILKPKQSFKILKTQVDHYPDFGIYLYRDRNVYLAIRCGTNGQNGNGGHAHNDQLSFELAINGITLISDPGTYLYTPVPAQRNTFRSTAWHSTVYIQDSEQNRWEADQYGLFMLRNDAKAHCIRWDNDTNRLIFTGKHYYGITGIKHIREIYFDKRKQQIHIEDSLHGQQKNLKGFFVLHTPLNNTTLSDDHDTLHIGSTRIHAGQEWVIENSLYSTHYGATQLSKRAVISFIDKISVRITFSQNFNINEGIYL